MEAITGLLGLECAVGKGGSQVEPLRHRPAAKSLTNCVLDSLSVLFSEVKSKSGSMDFSERLAYDYFGSAGVEVDWI
ncbi:hypothetical protein NHH88_05940 [Oxalobacteraceae bacterium OTU3CAMAD1]|nr:hypothetical protein NHH88_05940 [Oxalobacteraceae bacterium OTU3CAMAD1]